MEKVTDISKFYTIVGIVRMLVCLYVQWLAEKLDFLAVYDIKWRYFEWKLHTLKVLFCYFFKLCAYRYDFGFSNELLIITTA